MFLSMIADLSNFSSVKGNLKSSTHQFLKFLKPVSLIKSHFLFNK